MSTATVTSVRTETAEQAQQSEPRQRNWRQRARSTFDHLKGWNVTKGDIFAWLFGLFVLFIIIWTVRSVYVWWNKDDVTETVTVVEEPKTAVVATPHVDAYYSEDLTTGRRVLMKTNKEGLMQYAIDRSCTSAETLRAVELQTPPKVEYRAPTPESDQDLIARWQSQNGRAAQRRPYYTSH